MALNKIIFLTVVAFFSMNVWSKSVDLEKFKTHLRLHFFVPKDQVRVTKTGNTIGIETLNKDVFNSIKNDLSTIPLKNEYIESVAFIEKEFPRLPLKIEFQLTDRDLELFHFYKQVDKVYILDIWGDEKKIAPPQPVPSIVKTPPRPKKVVAKSKTIEKTNSTNTKKIVASKQERLEQYRDFRYGVPFIWDYPPLEPSIGSLIDLENKTPLFFYPLKDREFEKDPKEAHMQLSINLFRKEKWGLMYKSIKLYREKYDEDINSELNEYMKACSLIKKNLKGNDLGPIKTAVNMLKNLSLQTQNYELKKGLLQYLIQFEFSQKNYLEVMDLSKRLYVETMQNFDRELAAKSAEMIMYSLTKLNQVEKLESFLKEKEINKLIPNQIKSAYLIYQYLKRNELTKVIKHFKKIKDGLIKPVEGSIYFNTAEAYFRNANYKLAAKNYDNYIKDNSFHSNSSRARLRLALSYDLMGRDTKLVRNLYLEAINKSTIPEIRYEAKVRLIGLIHNRNKTPSENDLEYLAFLERREDEKNVLDNKELKKSLWLTRLRVLITQDRLKEALEYLKAIPIVSMDPRDKNIFEGDGSEIIFGLINQLYKKTEYAQVIRVWEAYQDQYATKVASDPHSNFLLASSYIMLGLDNGHKRSAARLAELQGNANKEYPIWIKRKSENTIQGYLVELKIMQHMKSRKWNEVINIVDKHLAKDKNFTKGDFYKGIAYFELKNYEKSLASLESYILNQKQLEVLSERDNSYLFNSYLYSLYQQNKYEKFKTSAQAILKDLEIKGKNISDDYKSLKERTAYLLIEVLSGEDSIVNYNEIKKLSDDFVKNFAESDYLGRVEYLMAKTYVENGKKKEGKDLFNKIINSEKAPDYIRELSKSELTEIILNEKSL